MRRCTTLLMLAVISAGLTWSQGINTQANKNDWEEINFDFDSSVLVDGFPSLLRVAELLQANPGARVRVEGNTDVLGSPAYNQALGLARANSVRDFLLKYGATAAQITTSSRGATAPKASDQGNTFQKTDTARFMNRRVTLTVLDANGNPIAGPGSAGDAIRQLNGQAGTPNVGQPGGGAGAAAQGGGTPGAGAGQGGNAGAAANSGTLADCCDQVLKRLDKLDEIASLLKGLADQNAALRRDVDGLKQNQQALQNAMNGVAGAAGRGGAQGNAGASAGAVTAANASPSATDIATAVREQLARNPVAGSASGAAAGAGAYGIGGKSPFQQLAFTVGADDRGKVSTTGRGRFFAPIGKNFGFQAQAEYYYLQGQKEGQFDFGLVDRFSRRFQAGLFGSFKTVSLSGNQTSGTLGQGSFVMDYFFGRGKIGIFGSKAFKDNALINRVNPIGPNGILMRNIIEERYLKVVDQVGVSAAIGLIGNTYAEANIGYLRSAASSNRAGGSLRFVLPVNDHVAFTVEGGVNETYLPFKGAQQGRAAVGVQLGNFLRPKEYLAADHAVAMEIPRVRYETLTRRTRTGNDPPIADAGPDRSNVSAGVIQLDGSATYDPDGDPLTYQWVQETGAPSPISGATSAKAAFTAIPGQVYAFRLTASDDQGGKSTDRVQISTITGTPVVIQTFQATPPQISVGQNSTLNWSVLNADTVTISGLGDVPTTGSRAVAPSATTTYILTARSSVNEQTATATVIVNSARFQSCFVSPTNIRAGESATLTWQSNGSTGVSISPGIGTVGANGSVTVSPTANTTYTLTTTGGGSADSCTVNLGVGPATGGGNGGNGGRVPDVVRFRATPILFENGGQTTLEWAVDDADTVTISGLGTVAPFGSRVVKPTEPTSYLLTATNANGTTTTRIFVNVYTIPLAHITSFTVDKPTVAAAGTPIKLTCNTTGAATVMIANAQFYGNSPSLDAFPPKDTTYTCIATNPNGQTETQTVSVKVTGPAVP
ncbi:MAG: OmpA family protein [Bryobacteraceae bacterium]